MSFRWGEGGRPPRPGRRTGAVLWIRRRSGQRRRARSPAVRAARPAEAGLALDERLDPVGQLGLELVPLRVGEPAVLDRVGELRLGGLDESGDEALDGLALCLGDLRQARAITQLLVQLRLGQAEVVRGRVEAAEEVVAPAVHSAAGADPDEREVAGAEPLLQLLALRLGETARIDRGVDAVGERLFERRLHLRLGNPELLRHVGDDRVTFLGRGHPIGGERCAAADRRGEEGRSACELQLLLHAVAPSGAFVDPPSGSARPKSSLSRAEEVPKKTQRRDGARNRA